MFTKADYDKYFDQIARVERKMIYGSYELGRQLKDLPLTRSLQKIGDDEVRHYGYVLKMLKEISGSAQEEKRRETREYCLGIILMRSLHEPSAKEVRGYCVNLSENGMCLEGAENLLPGGTWELAMQPFGKKEAICRWGKAVWSKEVEPGFYISGVEFDG